MSQMCGLRQFVISANEYMIDFGIYPRSKTSPIPRVANIFMNEINYIH